MRVAFFGLGYHAKTGSSRFLLDLLEQHATVEAFFAEPGVAAVRRAAPGFDETRYDAIVIWQLHEAFALLSGRHPNVTFAPMYDAMWRGGAFTWRHSFSAAKILCFSWALAAEVTPRAPVLTRMQYFPEADPAPVTDFDTLRGFLWYRRRDIPPEAVFAQTAGTTFASLAIHDAPDPGHAAPFPKAAPAHVGKLIRSTWSEDGGAFREALAGANVFFAPRPLEGIGMAFLEAMARGLCVVAPDAPTMNEYVSHGANGLLYAPGRRAPLDFDDARGIGARARDGIIRGRAQWEAGIPALLDFLATPHAALAARGASIPTRWALPAEWHIRSGDGVQQDSAALRRVIAAAPSDALIVRGHHVAREPEGGETLHRIGTIDAAWARLLTGDVGPKGPRGLGVPEATLIHDNLLRRYGIAAPQTAQTLCSLLLRARKDGVAIHDADEVLACRPLPEDWPTQRRAWYQLVAAEAGASAAATVLEALDDAAAAARARRRAAAPARAAIRLIGLCDRIAPAFGRAVESLLLGGAVRRLRAVLRR
ncbi:glycosyltransferase [Roseomonas sp. HJA6]|uniref:Glycosyltransferase n=1 Tax=Roseomonas alba TaxID=2846776 RepID=A0ABS7A920_9PROT|nr:glycosyltransferase [Neoroseomonas alba]MBW6397820.1 glycosyltransferase [Neoroseomonas alba]